MSPLAGSPANRAGAAAIPRATEPSVSPRARAPVHTAGSETCSEAIPPHARPKSPTSSRLSSGVHGEWSLTTRSTSPSASAAQSASRCAASRIGGEDLKDGGPAGTPPAGEVRGGGGGSGGDRP